MRLKPNRIYVDTHGNKLYCTGKYHESYQDKYIKLIARPDINNSSGWYESANGKAGSGNWGNIKGSYYENKTEQNL